LAILQKSDPDVAVGSDTPGKSR